MCLVGLLPRFKVARNNISRLDHSHVRRSDWPTNRPVPHFERCHQHFVLTDQRLLGYLTCR